MNLLIFGFGVFVFLITVYGTVVTGGMLLTDRQHDEQPELLENADTPPGVPREDLTLVDRLVDY